MQKTKFFFTAKTHKLNPKKFNIPPWYRYEKNNPIKNASVIGGGISGTATAYSLAIRGYKVRLYEKSNTLACGGSGNYQGLLYGTFHGNYTPLTELHFLGLQYSSALIQDILQESIDYAKSGLIQLSTDKNKIMRMHDSIRKNYNQFKENCSTPNHEITLNKGMGFCFRKNDKNSENYVNDLDYKNSCHPEPYQEAAIKNEKPRTIATDNLLQNNDEVCQYLNHNEIEELSGAKLTSQHGLYFPHGIWLHPRNFVNTLAAHPNITVILNTEITDIRLIENSNNSIWQLHTENKIIDETPNLILCNAHDAEKFAPTKNLSFSKTRGQTTTIKSKTMNQVPLCDEAYILPASNGYFTLGATFKPGETDTTIKHEEHMENIKAVSSFLPAINTLENVGRISAFLPKIKELKDRNIRWSFLPGMKNIPTNDLSGHAAIRCSSKDYLPLVGPLTASANFFSIYKDLGLDKNLKITTRCSYLPGLFLNLAHGAKGFTTAPICGEIIASYIDNSKFSCSEQLRHALHPNRFWLKDIIRGKEKTS